MDINVNTNPEDFTLNVDFTFPHPIEKVWKLYSDPETFAKWWGPGEWPATVASWDFRPGGFVHYYMTGPDGTEAHGRWDVRDVDEPNSFTVLDTFADADGNPNPDMPGTVMTFTLEPVDGGTHVTSTAQYDSVEAIEQVLAMGMIEGMSLAIEQAAALLDATA